jgi:putative ferrous iron transport protein C
MIDLIQLKHYLRGRKVAPLQDMALHFKVDMTVVQPLLEVWVAKGKARKVVGSGNCGGCCKCDAATIELYTWLD